MNGSLGRPWFAARRYGIGSGLPIAWQGWAALGLFVGGTLASGVLLVGWVRGAAAGGLAVAFAVVCALKTEGGWRWRSRGS